MLFTKLWIHAVWATKDLNPVLETSKSDELFLIIKEVAKNKFIEIDCINGTSDHLHCLMKLNAETSVAKAMFVLREFSKDYANKNNLLNQNLEWSDDYVAVSVSESMIDKTRDYIKTQNEIHKTKSYLTELNEFVERYKFNII